MWSAATGHACALAGPWPAAPCAAASWPWTGSGRGSGTAAPHRRPSAAASPWGLRLRGAARRTGGAHGTVVLSCCKPATPGHTDRVHCLSPSTHACRVGRRGHTCPTTGSGHRLVSPPASAPPAPRCGCSAAAAAGCPRSADLQADGNSNTQPRDHASARQTDSGRRCECCRHPPHPPPLQVPHLPGRRNPPRHAAQPARRRCGPCREAGSAVRAARRAAWSASGSQARGGRCPNMQTSAHRLPVVGRRARPAGQAALAASPAAIAVQ